jgi:hypothetical protein
MEGDLTHLAGHVAAVKPGTVPVDGPAPAGALAPASALGHERIAAARLAEHVAAGDIGAVRQFVHQLEHGLGPFRAHPWRLVEAMASLAITCPPASGDRGDPPPE